MIELILIALIAFNYFQDMSNIKLDGVSTIVSPVQTA